LAVDRANGYAPGMEKLSGSLLARTPSPPRVASPKTTYEETLPLPTLSDAQAAEMLARLEESTRARAPRSREIPADQRPRRAMRAALVTVPGVGSVGVSASPTVPVTLKTPAPPPAASPRSTPSAPPKLPASRPSRRRVLPAIALAVGISALAVLGWHVARRTAPATPQTRAELVEAEP
jgi:hypothetical protein